MFHFFDSNTQKSEQLTGTILFLFGSDIQALKKYPQIETAVNEGLNNDCNIDIGLPPPGSGGNNGE